MINVISSGCDRMASRPGGQAGGGGGGGVVSADRSSTIHIYRNLSSFFTRPSSVVVVT